MKALGDFRDEFVGTDGFLATARMGVAAGVQKIIFVLYKYEAEQIEAIARDIIPRLKARRPGPGYVYRLTLRATTAAPPAHAGQR